MFKCLLQSLVNTQIQKQIILKEYIVLILLLSHFIGDYALQNDYIAINKGKDNYVLAAHVATWTFVVSIVAVFLKLNISSELIVCLLFIPHYTMDYIKARNILWCRKLSPKLSLTIDQVFHFSQIIALYIITK